MGKSQNQKLEEQLKKQLDLKYSAASQLLKEARASLGIGPDENLDHERELEVLDEAVIIFEDDLTPEEQDDMKQKAVGEQGEEPAWQKKARLAAEKREREWEEENEREKEARREAARKSREQTQPRPAVPSAASELPPPADPDLEPVVTRVVRKKTVKGSVGNRKPGEVKTCYCLIL